MVRRVVLLTATELRHEAFRKVAAVAPSLEVVAAVVEDRTAALRTKIAGGSEGDIQRSHLSGREHSERDFFGLLCESLPDGCDVIPVEDGGINDPALARRLEALGADAIAAYGCSIVKEPLLRAFEGRFFNVHLGLSPYYRGSGTNFWPLVHGAPEFVGATFMYIDAGIDTGEIIDQLRARVVAGDSPHQIGNRLIADMIQRYVQLLSAPSLERVEQIPVPRDAKVFRNADFTPEAVRTLYQRFSEGLVDQYLAEASERVRHVPIRTNPALPPPAP